MRWAQFLVLAVFAGLLVWVSGDLPDRAAVQAPANQHVSPHYLRHAQTETGVPNVVAAVLADYRGYDTLGELVVVFTAGLACLFVLGGSNNDERSV